MVHFRMFYLSWGLKSFANSLAPPFKKKNKKGPIREKGPYSDVIRYSMKIKRLENLIPIYCLKHFNGYRTLCGNDVTLRSFYFKDFVRPSTIIQGRGDLLDGSS